jgi:hypothetical protein
MEEIMELFGRNQLFKLMLLSIVLYPLVPGKYTPYVGIFMGLYFVVHLYVDKDAYQKLRRGRRHNKLAYGLSTFLFLVLQVVTVTYSINPSSTLKGIMIYGSAFILFFILKYELNRPNFIIPLVRAYFLSGLLVGLYHVGQVVYDEIVRGIPFDPLVNVSFMDNAPLLAYFMLIPLFPALGLYIYKDENHESRFYLFVLSVALISVFMTGSRIAVISVFLGLGMLSFLYSLKFLIALVPTGLFLVLIPVFSKRHGQFFALSGEMSRFSFYLQVVRENMSTIFIGKGFNTFDETFGRFMIGRPELLNLELVNKPYNAVIQVVMEMGIIGLILGALIIFFKMRGIIQYTKSVKVQPVLKVMYVGVMVSMTVLILVGIMDSYLLDPKIVYSITILMGILHGDAKWKGITKI